VHRGGIEVDHISQAGGSHSELSPLIRHYHQNGPGEGEEEGRGRELRSMTVRRPAWAERKKKVTLNPFL